MTTTKTIRARAAIVATIAAICFAVAACGTEQGTTPDREGRHTMQHAAADDVAAQVEHRKAELTQELDRPQHAVTDDVERWVEQRKSAHGTH
jgi:hypothetical protein